MTDFAPLHDLARLIRGSSSRETLRSALRFVNFSWLTLFASVALSLLGIYAIDVAESVSPAPGDLASTAWRQVVFMLIGMIAATIVALPHYRLFGTLAWPALIGVIGLLVFLLVPAVPSWLVTPRNGARGWINLGVIDFQPSEVAKIAYVLVIAMYLRYRTQHRRFLGLVVPGLITAVPVGLITLQPDLGTAFLFVPSLFAMLIVAGARLRHLIVIVALAGASAPAAYPFLQPHQKTRIVALVKQFQGDRSTAHDISYQPLTAQRLVGAGRGRGHSDTAARALVHYNRLPERHNDMIFAVIAARFGLLGAVGVMALYVLWISGALLVAATCRDPLGRLIAVGLGAFVATQMVINIGMNIGLVPIIGITLPFVSYGGSSMITVWLMTALVVNVALHRPRPPYRESFEYGTGDEAHKPNSAYWRGAGFSGRAITR